MTILKPPLQSLCAPVLFAMGAATVSGAHAAPDDYRFEVVQSAQSSGGDSTVTVALIHMLSGKRVTDADVFRRETVLREKGPPRIDERQVPLTPDGQGNYRLATYYPLSDSMALKLGARVAGETATIRRTVRASGSAIVPVSAAQQTTRAVLIESVSSDNTLRLPNGSAIRAPIAPGVFAVYRGPPPIFEIGRAAGTSGLETLAEDGNPEPLAEALGRQAGVQASGLFIPGQPFTVTVQPGDKLAFAAMFVQSNDLFYGLENGGIDLFDSSGKPITGDISGRVVLHDAGTEINEHPGVGSSQAPRQAKPNNGPSESKPVQPVADGFAYPATAAVIRVTVE